MVIQPLLSVPQRTQELQSATFSFTAIITVTLRPVNQRQIDFMVGSDPNLIQANLSPKFHVSGHLRIDNRVSKHSVPAYVQR